MSQTKSTVNRRITLAERPVGEPTSRNFALIETPIPEPGAGEFLVRTLALSLDPYMRGRMSDAKSYADPVAVGDVMIGGAVSEVVKSNNPKFAPGDIVMAYTGWQDYAVTDGVGVNKIDPKAAPITTALGILGMPGMTAYTGLLTIGQPKPGETVVVSAASGAVGSAVGQIAKIKGARAVGIAGGPEKCAYVINELGFDACVDYKAADFAEKLAAACPKGIDVYFENVGGPVFDAVLPLMNTFGRIPVCGRIAQYNDTELPPGPDRGPLLMVNILVKRLTVRGFIVFDFADQEAAFLRDVAAWIKDGKIKYREDIVDGLENAPTAFMGLLKGKNFGKLIVKV